MVATLGTFVVSCACATLALMTSVSFAVFHIYHRGDRIVRMSSPRLNILISGGGAGLSVTCLLYGMDFLVGDNHSQLSPLCQVRVWLLVSSVTLVFCPVTTKAWRIRRIFKVPGSKVVIRDARLLLMTGAAVLVDVLFLILWQTIDPLISIATVYTTQTLDSRMGNNFRNTSVTLQECSCNRMEVWVTVGLLWKLILLSYGLFLAWKIKNVAIPPLNDSPSIIVAIFGTVTLGGVVGMVTCYLREFPIAVYVVTSLCISVAVILIQMVLFVPKVIYWWKVPSNLPLKMSTPSLKEGSNDVTDEVFTSDENGNSYHDDGIVQLVQENKALRESLTQKEDLVKELQVLVNRARDKLTSLTSDVDIRPDIDLNIDLSFVMDEETVREQRKDEEEGEEEESRRPCFPDLSSRIARYQQVEDSAVGGADSQTDMREILSHYKSNAGRTPGAFVRQDPQEENCIQRDSPIKHAVSVRSVSSRSSYAELYDLRKALDADLASAAVVSSNLQRSVSYDLDRSFSETEWLYQTNESKDLTESITQSYDLGEAAETESFLSSYIPRGKSLYQIQRSRRRISLNSLQSSDNASCGSGEIASFDNICEPTNCSVKNTGSSTPDSQHHAAILRYYAYRHVQENKLLQLKYPRRRTSSGVSRDQHAPDPEALKKKRSADCLDNSTASVFTVEASQIPNVESNWDIWRTAIETHDSFV